MKGKFAPALRISDFTPLRQIKQTGFYQEMARHFTGWRDQAAVPVRLPGSSLGFALNRDKRFSDEELLMLELLQPHIERVLRRSTQYLSLTTESPLTPRQREVLHWVSEGKRDSEIAVILGISVRTVEQHVRVCLQNLGVENRAAAVTTVWRARQGIGGTRG
jgi:DNA-binding CsgD family transcriptional regulator